MLGNLQSLSLNNNDLASLPEGVFAELENLQKLNLGSNALVSWPEGVFEGLENLQGLHFGGNGLTSLPEGVFERLGNLQSLSLNNNDLASLPEAIFEGLENLQWLDFRSNELVSLPDGVFAGRANLRDLYLNDNPGSPFDLSIEVIETPRPGEIAISIPLGMPFTGEITLSAEGGMVSPAKITIPTGATSIEDINVTRNANNSGTIEVNVASFPRFPVENQGRYSNQLIQGLQFSSIPLVIPGNIPTSTEFEEIPETLTLHTNYPNPFNPQTTIDYALPSSTHVRLVVYDMTGKTVSILVDGEQVQGQHTVNFRADHLPTGTYIYRLTANGETRTRKMTLIR